VKKFAIGFSIIICLLLLYLVGTYGYVIYKLYSVKKDTYEYLLNEKKYDENEIYEIDSKLGVGIKYQATVIFEDEKDIVYEYAKLDGEIKQIFPDAAETDYRYKHKE